MSTRFTLDRTYAAPLPAVRAMLDDRAYREQVLAAQGSRRGTVEMGSQDGDPTVVLDQVQPADGIPSFAQKFVGSEINIVQREVWTSTTHAELEVTIPGKPGEMAGSITLSEEDGATTETVDVEISVRLPLVGGRLEKLVADMLRKALRSEEQVAHDYLSR